MRNLIPHFIQEQYQQENYGGTFEALTIFVDVKEEYRQKALKLYQTLYKTTPNIE